jgi:hypothetical protein
MKCHGGKHYTIKAIREHLCLNKQDPFFMHSMLRGDPKRDYLENGIWVDAAGEILSKGNAFHDSKIKTQYAKHMDLFHDIQ